LTALLAFQAEALTNMHLPDGFLDAKTSALSAAVAVAAVAVALREVRVSTPPRQMPLLGLAAAFVFAAQMINFPILGGTSGHLIGGVLTAVLLGPSAAVLVMTCVLIVQCLMFADGGLLALGANVFNMALASVGIGWLVFRALRRLLPMDARRATVLAAAFAAWCGTVAAALGCAGQLALSGTVPWTLGFPAMVNVHLFIGLGEGVITGLVVAAVMAARPELVAANAARSLTGRRSFLAYGLLITAGMAVFVAPFACPWPDGLEKVAEHLGFAGLAGSGVITAPMPDYQIPFLGSATVATAVAGLVGAAVAFGVAYVLARLLIPTMALGLKPEACDSKPQ
jgi:cobalt/nickel transport system permease protein